MTINVGINGFGRIGRCALRALYESGRDDIKIVAINDTAPIETSVHLMKYDSIHGRFKADVVVNGKDMAINGDHIEMMSSRDPKDLHWGENEVDVLLECTGKFRDIDSCQMHLDQGAKKVLISAPAGRDMPTVVFGVNENILKASDIIVSNASCTTNCLAPVVKPLNDTIGIERGWMTTIHAYTNDQRLTDVKHKDLRRARAATMSMIPTKTGAATAVGLVLPELNGKLDGFSIRVPTVNVSVIDLTFDASRTTTVEEINAIMKKTAGESNGILGYTDEPLVSVDFNHDTHSAVFDAEQTRILDGMVKVVAWYDNEWGFSNRMLDTAALMGNL